jgi:hypothetical protein
MLKVEPLSMEWFNTPSLRLDASTAVSRSAASETDLIDLVEQGLEERLPPLAPQIERARQQIFSDLYTAIDGASASRVTDVILQAVDAVRQGGRVATAPQPSARGIVAGAVRRTLGYKGSSMLRRSYGSAENERRRAGKGFAADQVNLVLHRLEAASSDGRRFGVQRAGGDTPRIARAVSGASLQLVEVN